MNSCSANSLPQVKGDRQAVLLVRAQQFNDRLLHHIGPPARQRSRQGKAALALDQRDQHPLVALADDDVALPVAQALARVYDGRAVFNADAVCQRPAALVPAAVAFAALFLATQVTEQIPATVLVAVDVEINAFVTDGPLAFERQAPADLLGRQPQAHIALHLQPAFGLDRARIAAGQLALLGQRLSLLCYVALLARHVLALAPNGAAVAA